MLRDCGLVPVTLALDLSSYEDDWRHVSAFRGSSGWLLIADITVQSEHDMLRARIAVGCDEQENAIPAWRGVHLADCAWSALDYCVEQPPEILDDLLCEEEGALFARWQREANSELAALYDRAQTAITAMERQVARDIGVTERQIADLQRRRRMAEDEEHRRIFQLAIGDLEEANERAMESLIHRRVAMRRAADDAEERLWSRADVLIEAAPLRLVRWRDAPCNAEHRTAPIWREGHYYPGPTQYEYVERVEVDMVLAQAAASMKQRANEAKPSSQPKAAPPMTSIMKLPKLSPIRQQKRAAVWAVADDGSWTRDRVARLRVMWAGGYSAGYIADALGDTSRNAIINKAKRLGLKSRAGNIAGQYEDEEVTTGP